MEDVFKESSRIFQESLPEGITDKLSFLTSAQLMGMECFLKISSTVHVHGPINFPEKETEEMAFELTKILFYTACICKLEEIDEDEFKIGDLIEFSEEFEEDHQQDSILCCSEGIRGFITLMNIEMERKAQEELEEEERNDPAKQSIAEIFACVIILCDLLNLDLEVVMSNVSVIESF